MNFEAQFRAALREREMRIERTINRLRFGGVVILGGADVLGLGLTSELHGAVVALVALTFAVFAAYCFAVERLTSGARYRPWLKYVTIAVDHALLVCMAVGYLRLGVDFGLPPGAIQALVASSVVLLTLLGALRTGRGPLLYSIAAGVASALVVSFTGTPQPLLALFSVILVVAAGLLALSLSEGTAALFRRLRQREGLLRFLSRDVVDRIDAGAIPLELGGRTRPVTVLISDIRGFTSLSEHLDPQQVVALLNDYFSRMTAIVFAEGGTVDKFIGDGMLAVFGAPVEHDDHARRALRASTRMLEEVEALNARFRAEGRAPIAIGIALHTGPVVSGIIGSPERMEYTVIGDTVNVTSRIESLNKEYGTKLLFTEETWRAAGEDGRARALGEAPVRGRTGALRLYTLDEPTAAAKVG